MLSISAHCYVFSALLGPTAMSFVNLVTVGCAGIRANVSGLHKAYLHPFGSLGDSNHPWQACFLCGPLWN